MTFPCPNADGVNVYVIPVSKLAHKITTPRLKNKIAPKRYNSYKKLKHALEWQYFKLKVFKQRPHDAITTSLLRRIDVATSFWRYNDVGIMP